MSRDFKTGLLAGLGIALLAIMLISLWPNQTVEQRRYGTKHVQPEYDRSSHSRTVPKDNQNRKDAPLVTLESSRHMQQTNPPAPEAEPIIPHSKTDGMEFQKPRIHTVQQGETLSSIAVLYYGTGSKYLKIYQANKDIITDADRIVAGMILRIPAD